MYAAFLRGVSPMNLKMAALAATLESAGMVKVKTVLASGNVVFSTCADSEEAIEKKLEAAMTDHLGRAFYTIVGPSKPERAIKLPLAQAGAMILSIQDRQVFSDYVVGPDGPVFMTLLEKTFGKNITTRTWDTVTKVVAAADKLSA